MHSSLEILLIKQLLFLVSLLPTLIMFYELGKDLPHEFVMFLHELFLLFKLLVVLVHIVFQLLFAHILKDSFHVLVIPWGWELRKRNYL